MKPACSAGLSRIDSMVMTASQILIEIKALPQPEREELFRSLSQIDDIPQDFLDALDDFEKGRFVSMETALNEDPPVQ